MEDDFMLSTYDNEFNPFTDFIIWWKEDLRLGHDCCGTLARETNTSFVLSDIENEERILTAIDEIVKREPMIYRKVSRKDYKTLKGKKIEEQ